MFACGDDAIDKRLDFLACHVIDFERNVFSPWEEENYPGGWIERIRKIRTELEIIGLRNLGLGTN